MHARYNNRENRLTQRLIEMRNRGQIPEATLLLYGISGELPGRHPTRNREYTHEEKIAILQRRMQSRFGISWREQFRSLPNWLNREAEVLIEHNWQEEGF